MITIDGVCQHVNQEDDSWYDYDDDIANYGATCLDCGAVYNNIEDTWYDQDNDAASPLEQDLE